MRHFQSSGDRPGNRSKVHRTDPWKAPLLPSSGPPIAYLILPISSSVLHHGSLAFAPGRLIGSCVFANAGPAGDAFGPRCERTVGKAIANADEHESQEHGRSTTDIARENNFTLLVRADDNDLPLQNETTAARLNLHASRTFRTQTPFRIPANSPPRGIFPARGQCWTQAPALHFVPIASPDIDDLTRRRPCAHKQIDRLIHGPFRSGNHFFFHLHAAGCIFGPYHLTCACGQHLRPIRSAFVHRSKEKSGDSWSPRDPRRDARA